MRNTKSSPKCCHRDDGVPKGCWDGLKSTAFHILEKKHGDDDGDSFGKAANHDDDSHLFTIEHDGGEDDDGHGKGEDKEAQLGGARLSFEYQHYVIFF